MKKSYLLSIADLTIEIYFSKTPWTQLQKKLKRDIHYQCKWLIRNDTPSIIDFKINYIHKTQAQILSFKNTSSFYIFLYESINGNKIATVYQDGIFLFLLLLRIVIQKLLSQRQGFIIHSSSVATEKIAYLFLGAEGAGKSTVVLLLSSKYKPLTDDVSIIKKVKNEFYLYQSPFTEKINYKKTNQKYKIGKIFFLNKSEKNHLIRIFDKNRIMKLLSRQITFNPKNYKQEITTVRDFIEARPFYFLYFNKNKEELASLLEKL